MPGSLSRNILMPFSQGVEIPVGMTGSIKNRTTQYGETTLKGENPEQVLSYVGERSSGSMVLYRPDPGMPPNAWNPPSPWDSSAFWQSEFSMGTGQHVMALRNRAYEKFKEKAIGESSQMGTFLAEGRESYGMIAKRATGLYRAYRSLKKGNFRDFLRELSVKPKRKHRSVTRTAAGEASGLWLEYWFGWSPSVNDLFNAYEILTRQMDYEPTWGTSRRKLPVKTVRVQGGSFTFRESAYSGYCLVKTGAHVTLVNPNAAIRSSLGLNNPLSIAWDLVPFSFVVDWFTQFGNTLSAMTDFAGFTLQRPYTTSFQECEGYFHTWNTGYAGPYRRGEYKFKTFQQRRQQVLVKPVVLRPRIANFGSSVTRAATAVSLLNSIFLDR